MINDQLEKILNFEGQEIKIKTDEGVELFNLANSAKICGLARKDTGRITWKGNRSVYDKLDKIRLNLDKMGSAAFAAHKTSLNNEINYVDEINYILNEIEETDDRNSIYISRYLTSMLAMECHNDKAMQYKSWLATLDESYSNGTLTANNPYLQLGNIADSMKLMSNMMNQMGQVFNGMQEYVQSSIQAKDLQIDQISELIGFKNVNTKRIVNEIKDKLSEKLGKKIYASSNVFQEVKQAIFKEFSVIKWEDVQVQNYNRVYAFVDELIENKYGKAC